MVFLGRRGFYSLRELFVEVTHMGKNGEKLN